MKIRKNLFDIIINPKNNKVDYIAPDNVEDIADYIVSTAIKKDLNINFYDLNCLLYYVQFYALQNSQIAFSEEFKVGAYIPQVLSLYYNIEQRCNKLNSLNQEVVIDSEISDVVDFVLYNKGSLDTLTKVKEVTSLGSAYQYTKFTKGINANIPLDLIIKDNIDLEDTKVKRK